jgi:hypothetical protein
MGRHGAGHAAQIAGPGLAHGPEPYRGKPKGKGQNAKGKSNDRPVLKVCGFSRRRRTLRPGPHYACSPSCLNSSIDLRILHFGRTRRGPRQSAILAGRVIQTAGRPSLDPSCLKGMEHVLKRSAKLSSNLAAGHPGKVHLSYLQVACALFWLMANDPSVPAAHFTSGYFWFHVSSSATALCPRQPAPSQARITSRSGAGSASSE